MVTSPLLLQGCIVNRIFPDLKNPLVDNKFTSCCTLTQKDCSVLHFLFETICLLLF